MSPGGRMGTASEPGSSHAAAVARYYDRNTRRFLLVGSRGAHAIHRELWAPGVRTAAEASAYVDHLLADEIADVVGDRASGESARVIDFGCGVGGTLFRLADRFPGVRCTGVTVSRRQVAIARHTAQSRGQAERCAFEQADFQSLDLGVRAAAIVAVESFAHSDRVDAFLASAARHLLPDGRLVIVDDFLARDERGLEERERRHVAQLRAGWRVPAVCTLERLRSAARAHGLHVEKAVDLTDLTRPGRRLRDRVVGLVSPLLAPLGLERFPFYGNLIGGNALQIGLREGFLRYQLVTLSKAT